MWRCSYRRKALNIKAVWMSLRCRGWVCGEMLSSQPRRLRSPSLYTCLFISFNYSSLAKQAPNLSLYECLCVCAALEQRDKYLAQRHLPLVKATQLRGCNKAAAGVHISLWMLIQRPLTSWTWAAQDFVNSAKELIYKWQRSYLGDNSASQSRTNTISGRFVATFEISSSFSWHCRTHVWWINVYGASRFILPWNSLKKWWSSDLCESC